MTESRTGGAVLVRDGRIAAVGSLDEVSAASVDPRAATQVDLAGGLLLPGFQDAHVHPAPAGVEMLQCDLSGADSAEETLALIARYAAASDDDWLQGGGWTMDHFAGGSPHRTGLDGVTGDRPAFLVSRDHHSAWVNSVALARAGITASTPDPADGVIERDADGTPSGTLHEGALSLLDGVKPVADEELAYRGLLAAQSHLIALGITGWQDALVGEGLGFGDSLPLYLRAVQEETLVARVTGALWWHRERGIEQLPELLDRRSRAAALARPDLFMADTVKMMLDGIVENHTASIHGHYRLPGGDAGSGLDFIDPERLGAHLAALDSDGFSVHFHALGDRAVTQALDAVEALGGSARRHQLAHLQMVADADLPRFASVGAIANLQAFWARTDDQLRDLCLPILPPGARERTYPFGRLARAGAALAFGSDWPVSTADPLAAVHVAVNRTGYGAEPEPLGGDRDKLDLATALGGYTAGSAHANGRGSTTGRLRAGYLADIVVLDRDPFRGAPDEIGDTRVTQTWIAGTRHH
ncbi:amidohydrolase [Herbiconiux moechotypicola]|nr:amidohydrolase [Herbiconiux moechotypicola]